jgi:anaerobic selenocysteine-containing dehydrogenase
MGAKLVVVSPRSMSLDAFATHVVRCAPGGEASALRNLGSATQEPGAAARDLGDPLVVCWGPSSPGRDESAALVAALALRAERDAKMLVCPPHAGSQGLIDMGVHPVLDAGHAVAEERGRDTRAILEGIVAGELDALVIFGADLIADFPDAELALRALEASPFTVVVELFPTETVSLADVVLPSVAYAEREGTFTNLERRLQKLEPLVSAPGSAQEPWRICAGIARALGDEWGWTGFDDVWVGICKDVSTHSSVDAAALAQRVPPAALNYESGYEIHEDHQTVAGPGGGYPKGHRAGAPFQTGQNWPLSWELRAFEAKQRPGFIPPAPEAPARGAPAVETPERLPEAADLGVGEFVLLSGRMLYDDGSMVARSTALRAIARKPFVEMAGSDAARLGVTAGDHVLVTAGENEARLEVVVGDISEGALFVPYDQDGFRANTLMSGGASTVRVRKP